ncbi:MAG: hypothetical protein JSU87_13820 [Gemmatimonadota bacterium]|nr:MAG: hypothetical protein JSU87_13820 [Gemmatimonadota bacterium]
MSRSSLGGLLLALGLVALGLFSFVLDLPSGLSFAATFFLGVLPTVGGLALIWAGWRSSGIQKDPEAARLAGVRDQIVWRAVALGGRITAVEAAAHGGLNPPDAERILMSLVADGRAQVEAGESGDIVYRIDSPVPGAAV